MLTNGFFFCALLTLGLGLKSSDFSDNYAEIANLDSGFWTDFDKLLINAAYYNDSPEKYNDTAYDFVMKYTHPDIHFVLEIADVNATGHKEFVDALIKIRELGDKGERHIGNMFELNCIDSNNCSVLKSDASITNYIAGTFIFVSQKKLKVSRQSSNYDFKFNEIIIEVMATIPLGVATSWSPQ